MATQAADSKFADPFQIQTSNPTFNYNGAGTLPQIDPADPLAGTGVKLAPQPGVPYAPPPSPTVLQQPADEDCGCGGSAGSGSGAGGVLGGKPVITDLGSTPAATSSLVTQTDEIPRPDLASIIAWLKTGTGLALLLILLALALSRRK